MSMSCLTLTFLLYSFLPQLRDLTGKFILGICSFLTTNYALRLVDVEMFGFKVGKCLLYFDGGNGNKYFFDLQRHLKYRAKQEIKWRISKII